jgi:hypothetical protein
MRASLSAGRRCKRQLGWVQPGPFTLLWFALLRQHVRNWRQDPAPGSPLSPSLFPFSAQTWPPSGLHPAEAHRKESLTQANGRFACPAAVCFAGAVLGATLKGEALLAGVDERVAHGG